MIKMRDLLEGKSIGILYHYSSWRNFEQILDSNLVLKDVEDRGTISFTRLGYSLHKFGECRFILNGSKMSQKYKIVPDSLAMLPNKQGKFFKDGKPVYKKPEQKQGEERIYGISSFDMKPYLLGIEINSTDNFSPSEERRIKEKLEKLNVPFKIENHGNWKSYKGK